MDREIAILLLFIMNLLLPSSRAEAGATIYDLLTNGGLGGFNAAAGSPPIAIDFESIPPNSNISGATLEGVTFKVPEGGAPLIVVRGEDTFTPGKLQGQPVPGKYRFDPSSNKLHPTSGKNVLSPGGMELRPGPDPLRENDDLELVFLRPFTAFGLDHLSQSSDGNSFTHIQVFNQSGKVLYAGVIPISKLGVSGAPGGTDFWGITTDGTDRIARIVIDEQDDNNVFPDCNIGFDSFRFFPQGEAHPKIKPVALRTDKTGASHEGSLP